MIKIRTLRGRLAFGYALALAATMFVFAAMIYLVQRGDRYDQLETRVRIQADLIGAILTDAYDRGVVVVPGDTVRVAPGQPTFDAPPSPPLVLAPRVDGLLQSVQDYILILDTAGTILYASEAARQTGMVGLGRLQNAAQDSMPPGSFDVVDVGGALGQIRYFVLPVSTAGPDVASVLAGASTAGVGVVTSRLVIAILVSGPLILSPRRPRCRRS